MSAPAFRAMAEFAATRHGVIVRSLAASFGLTPYDIRAAQQRGWITEPVRGVLVISGYPSTWEQRLAIVIASSTAGPVVSNGAATRLFGLDGFTIAPPEITLKRPGRISPRVAAGVIVHQTAVLEPPDRCLRNGLPCTSLARTLSDLGSTESPDRVWHALISARRLHRVNPTWLQQTAVRVHRPGQAGTGVLLAALRRWSSEGTLPDSRFEELVRRLLDHPSIPPLQSQFVLNDERGRFVARLDLAIPAARLGLEAHSREFHFGRSRRRLTRTAIYERRRSAGRCSTLAGTRNAVRPRWSRPSLGSATGGCNFSEVRSEDALFRIATTHSAA